MRALTALTVVMGVLIVGGTALLGVLVVRRLAAAPSVVGPVLLDEPAGTAIAEIAGAGDRLALRLSGGGPDRVLLLDARTGQVVGRVGLAR